jgi:D-alanyl-D-alanine carboxypeptidase
VIVLQHVADGTLHLDDTVRQLLPDLLVPNAETMTVEHLLRMRSGLFDFEDDPSLLGDLEAHLRPYTLRHVVGLAIRHEPLFAPGDRFSYCNTNFCVLELIVESITTRSLGDELQERVFGPLRLSGTSYPSEDDLALPEPYIRGYERWDNGWRDCSNVFFGRGDGALISTAVDLARFFRALLVEKTLLPQSLLEAMLFVFPDNPAPAEAYGLGLIADPLPCGNVWGHGGGGFGYLDLPYLQLETGRFAMFMLNGTYGYRVARAPSVPRPTFSPGVRALAYESPL